MVFAGPIAFDFQGVWTDAAAAQPGGVSAGACQVVKKFDIRGRSIAPWNRLKPLSMRALKCSGLAWTLRLADDMAQTLMQGCPWPASGKN
jgi:hypothetical protein